MDDDKYGDDGFHETYLHQIKDEKKNIMNNMFIVHCVNVELKCVSRKSKLWSERSYLCGCVSLHNYFIDASIISIIITTYVFF